MTPAERQAQAALRASDTNTLLQTFAGFTHRIHAEQVKGKGDRNDVKITDLRAQRDLIKTEIMRRTGDIQ